MPKISLMTGATKMHEALDNLQTAWAEVSEYWRDGVSESMEKHLQDELTPQMQNCLDAMRRTADVLGRAVRECSDERHM